MTTQNQETLLYFNKAAQEWQLKAEGKTQAVNVIAQRNQTVIRVMKNLDIVRRALDIGCGTGDLVLEMAAMGIEAIGVDFAPQMIEACNAKKRQRNTENATFYCESFFNYCYREEPLDLISALGFIEYISAAELKLMIGECAKLLRPGGALVIGSRNRLFNLFSLNDYTRLELELGIVDNLLQEAVALSSSADVVTFMESVSSISKKLPQPLSHPHTGIGVTVRFQYTPGELMLLLRDAGFLTQGIAPIHYHGMPAILKKGYMGLHLQVATLLNESSPQDHRLVPYSSSFVITARKA